MLSDGHINVLTNWQLGDSALQGVLVVLLPSWLERDKNALKGTVTKLPVREDIDVPIAEHLIVELYSK